jgi:hypothetical protein
MIKYVTGWADYSVDQFLKSGEKVFALERRKQIDGNFN